MSREVLQQALDALVHAEAGLADIGDADREPGDDLAWCEDRAAQALAKPREAIEALRAELAKPDGWMPIDTAPKDGTYILLGSTDGAWIARNYPVYVSGYRPEDPWQSMMLNHEHMGRYPKAKPTHWMPLPPSPQGDAPCNA